MSVQAGRASYAARHNGQRTRVRGKVENGRAMYAASRGEAALAAYYDDTHAPAADLDPGVGGSSDATA